MREVAQGMVYEVAFHGKPWVELRPRRTVRKPAPGSQAAFQGSLAITLDDSFEGLPPKSRTNAVGVEFRAVERSVGGFMASKADRVKLTYIHNIAGLLKI